MAAADLWLEPGEDPQRVRGPRNTLGRYVSINRNASRFGLLLSTRNFRHIQTTSQNLNLYLFHFFQSFSIRFRVFEVSDKLAEMAAEKGARPSQSGIAVDCGSPAGGGSVSTLAAR